MKKVSELKKGDAIRVNEKEWPQIINLFIEYYGDDWNVFGPGFNPITANNIEGDVVIYQHFGWDRLEKNYAKNTYPASDFLIPEPRFKVGDKVIPDYSRAKRYDTTLAQMKKYDSVPGYVNIVDLVDNEFFYRVHGFGWPESALELANGAIIESATLFGDKQQFEIGKLYEFSDDIETGWVKGKLLAVVDDEYKYIARVGADKEPSGWQRIRPIHPTKVERWINMSQSGNQVGKKCFESEMEACQHAPQSQNVFQIKLEGYANI